MAQKTIAQLLAASAPIQETDLIIVSRDGVELLKFSFADLLSQISDSVTTEVLTDPSVVTTGDIGTTVEAFDADIVKKDVENTFAAQQVPMSGSLTDGATINWDADVDGQVVSVTLAAANNFAAPTNIIQNAFYTLIITTGDFTPTFDTAFKWPDASAPAGLTGTCVFNFIGGAGNTLISNGYSLNVA